MNLYESLQHNLRNPYDRSAGQIDQILSLCEDVYNKTGKEITFDNTRGANKYILIVDGVDYTFALYRDVIDALKLILLFI